MGASNSRLEEDKGLQLCRARKKFIKHALNGRCSLASAHIAYTEELKIIGRALRRFVDDDYRADSFVFERSEFTDKPLSPSSLSRQYQSHHMKFEGTFSQKVEEEPPVNMNVSATVSSNTPQSTTPYSLEARQTLGFENLSVSEENSPWDYFGLFHPIGKGFDQGSEDSDETRNHKVEEEKVSSHETDDPEFSGDKFDEAPSLSNLVRSFHNVNTTNEKGNKGNSQPLFEGSEIKESEMKCSSSPENEEEVKENHVSEDSVSEIKVLNGEMHRSPDLSPLRSASSRFVHPHEVKMMPLEQCKVEDKVVPNDFVSSVKDIEQLFIRASESGKEVPRMLEANKFHFRPIINGRERESVTSSLLRSCFSRGQDPSEVPPEPPQNSVKYLTWHRTTSSRSASFRNFLGTTNTSTGNTDEPIDNLFDNFCMVSGSHASTLDRLYAWEKKLYDEVKAGQVLQSHFDQKCKLLRHQESRGKKTDKTRAVVKDLHTRIRVSIHIIDSISKKIEDIRDRELQPQLEELIEGLRKMWESMFECHQLQFHVISISHTPKRAKNALQTDSRRQITIHIENKLGSLSSAFTKWIEAQRIYVEAIDKWLFKCVSLQENTSKRNKRMKPPPIRNIGPPIYMLCGAWLEKIEELSSKAVVDSTKDLASEVASFLPRQEKNQGKNGKNADSIDDFGYNVLRDEDPLDDMPRLDRFKTSLAGFLGQLRNFAESSVKMFGELQKAVEEAKSNYEQFKSQQ